MEKWKLFVLYVLGVCVGVAIGYMMQGCKSTQKCDAYGSISVKGYEYVQVIGYTDTIPTMGENLIHLPIGEYELRVWESGQSKVLKVKL
jgi:hypothetical protein